MSRIDDLIAQHCPDGVQLVPLAGIGHWYGGGTPSKSKPDYWRNGTIPWLSPKDMGRARIETTQDYITDVAVRESTTKLVPPVSVALVVRSSILDKHLPSALIPMPVALNQDMKAVVPHDDIHPGYIAHLLRSRGDDILRVARKTGGSVASIETGKLLSYRIPVPPIEMQREIVRILDSFTQLEAELEAELEARRMQYAQYRSSLLTFGDEVKWSTLGDVAHYVNGKAHEKLADADGDIPMVTARFISRNGEANRFVPIGSVLTPASMGDTALVLSDLPNGRALARSFFIDRENGYAINQRVARLRVKEPERVNAKFLFYLVDRNPGLLKHDNGVDQTHLSKAQVTGLRFPIPPVDEQVRIATILDNFDALVNDLSIGLPAELAARRTQYAYYRDKLLTFKEKT